VDLTSSKEDKHGRHNEKSGLTSDKGTSAVARAITLETKIQTGSRRNTLGEFSTETLEPAS
jgi:hypothetical protein